MRLFTNWRKEKFNMRLTERKRNSDGTGVAKQNLIKDNGCFTRFTDEILTKLAEYEDLEERGRLVIFLVKLKILYIALMRVRKNQLLQ